MREIDKSFKNTFNDSGFRVKNTSWYRITEDFIQVIHFQKSLYSDLYYLNVAIDVKPTEKIIYKPEYKFSVRLRADRIIQKDYLLQALDFKTPLCQAERNANINAIIIDCVKFLDSISTWEQFKVALSNKHHAIHRAGIAVDFRQVLCNMDHLSYD